MATLPVWTIFGRNSDRFPVLFDTGREGNHVRAYVAGIFDVHADLANMPTSSVRFGVIYAGDATSGTLRVVHNGVIIHEVSTPGISQIRLTCDLDYYDAPARIARALGSLSDATLSWRAIGAGTSYWDVGDDYPIPDGETWHSFRTDDCKWAWYVDQATGLGDGVLDTMSPIYAYAPKMMTNPHPDPEAAFNIADYVMQSPSDSAFGGELIGDPLYDTAAAVKLNVNVGGHAPSWTYTGSLPNPWDGVTLDLGYPTSLPADPLMVDCAVQYVAPSLIAGDIDTDSWNEATPVTGANRAAYVVTEQTFNASLPTVGRYQYPGIATTVNGSLNHYIQAINFGLPVLYEQWFSTDLQGDTAEFWTKRISTQEILG